MCGIIGYVGLKNPIDIVLDGLKRLEYRGYDSAGIAGVCEGEIAFCKEVGKIAVLEKEVKEAQMTLGHMAIGQTRWATHGKPNKANAHPHFNESHSLAIVHNGIIENHDALRRELKAEGVKFSSDTDTEVVAHLIGKFYKGDLLESVKKTIPFLKGTFAIALIHRDFPDQIIAIAHESPLVVGIGTGEAFVASDPHAFAAHTREVAFLLSGEIAVVKADKLEVFDVTKGEIEKKTEKMHALLESASKGSYEHYTLKEIFEQPQTIRNALSGRFIQDYGTALFEGINFEVNELLSVERILILACGTSWHAGYLAAYMLEDRARIPVQVEISSEFRYKNPVVPAGTLAIAISQSGETADTLAAVRELKTKGVKVLAICNVEGSHLAREADASIFLKAGQEIGVCSTKAFTSQVVVLSLFTLLMARMRHMDKKEGQIFLEALQKLPDQVQEILDQSAKIQEIAKKYAHYENFFYLGRSYMYPASLEGALKLKEISYINANGYPAGEMKHGPIALINENCPTVALCGNKATFEKLLSNLMEIKARSGKIIAIAETCERGLEGIADDIIYIPQTIDEISGVLTTVASQLLAYYIAKERGAEIDQPRNLAKSVTVE